MSDTQGILPDMLSSLQLKLYAFDRIRCGSWWDYRKVNSPFTRLFLTLGGSASVTFEGVRHALSENTMVITPPFTSVNYCCEDWFENYFVIFTGQVGMGGSEFFSLVDIKPQIKAPDDAHFLCERLLALNKGRGLAICDPANPLYNVSIWKAATDTLRAEDVLASDGCLRILLSYFLKNAKLKPMRSGESGLRLAKVFDSIDSNLEKHLSLDKLASLVNLHPTYFSDYFQKATGMRPLRYIAQRRTERARLLLLTSTMSMKEIATECGFPDVNYFFRAFKRQTGVTPMNYRLKGESACKIE